MSRQSFLCRRAVRCLAGLALLLLPHVLSAAQPPALSADADPVLPSWARSRPGESSSSPRTFVGLDPTDQNDDYLRYDIPKDAIKEGPFSDRNPRDQVLRYLAPDTRERLAVEHRCNGVLEDRELYKNDCLHGIQKTWHFNGKLGIAIPYKNGIRHGICKHWDKQGNLVGCYRMNNGTGVEKVYHSNGRLDTIREYRRNVANGVSWTFYENGNVRSMHCTKDNAGFGPSFMFYEDGTLEEWSNYDRNCDPDGPKVVRGKKLDRKTELLLVEYYVHGEKVDEKRYEEEAKKDPRLPPYRRDPKDYVRHAIPSELQAQIEQFKKLPPVKIPLEYKDESAPKAEQPKPKATK